MPAEFPFDEDVVLSRSESFLADGSFVAEFESMSGAGAMVCAIVVWSLRSRASRARNGITASQIFSSSSIADCWSAAAGSARRLSRCCAADDIFVPAAVAQPCKSFIPCSSSCELPCGGLPPADCWGVSSVLIFSVSVGISS